MICKKLVGPIVAAAVLCGSILHARAWDDAKYPDLKGQWTRIGRGGAYDPTKRAGLAQQPPLTPEYQALWQANLAEARAGGQFYNGQTRCLPGGMPRMMMPYEPMEIIV